jgi:predicted O-methyltransferase YrrM
MDIELVSPLVREYLHGLVPPRPTELQAMEVEAEKKSFPIIGPVCGHLCYQIARMIGAKQVFELGAGYGYSTAWFARAVKENGGGVVHHVVWDEELSREARSHLAALEMEDVVQYHVAEAVQILQEMPGPFDLIFNDIDKRDYPASLPVIKKKLRPGGVLIIDNMLWYGRVFDDADQAPDTRGVREFTRLIMNDSDWVVSLVPIRDGMIIAYKR